MCSSDLSGIFPMMSVTGSVPAGWEDISSIENWDKYYENAGEKYRKCRNQFITDNLPNWNSLTNNEKKILIKNYVYPDTTTQAEIYSHWTTEEHDENIKETMRKLNLPDQLVVKSITEGSDKYFNITVDDTGVADPQEIKTNETI